MSNKIELSYTIRGDVSGGSYRNQTDVEADHCHVTVLKGAVSLRRTSFLTPNRLNISFDYNTEVGISFEMARKLLDQLSTMNLDDETPEDEDD